jgi:hypothetical protein
MVGQFFINMMINMNYYDNLPIIDPECERALTVASG